MSRRVFWCCIFLSVFLHLALLGGPGWKIGGGPGDSAKILDTRLLTPKAAHQPEVPNTPSQTPEAVEARGIGDKTRHPPEARIASGSSPETRRPSADSAADPERDSIASVPDNPRASPEIAPPPSDTAPQLPHSGRILFSRSKGAGGFVVGRWTHEWQHDGKHYIMRATSEASGLAAWFGSDREVLASEGELTGNELRPARFSRDWSGGTGDTAALDWVTGRVTWNERRVIPLTEGAKDGLTKFYQLMQTLQRGGKEIAVVEGDRISYYELRVVSEDTLQLAAGAFKTWHVLISREGLEVMDVWLGKEILGLPVLIRYRENGGEVVELSAEEIRYEGQ